MSQAVLLFEGTHSQLLSSPLRSEPWLKVIKYCRVWRRVDLHHLCYFMVCYPPRTTRMLLCVLPHANVQTFPAGMNETKPNVFPNCGRKQARSCNTRRRSSHLESQQWFRQQWDVGRGQEQAACLCFSPNADSNASQQVRRVSLGTARV